MKRAKIYSPPIFGLAVLIEELYARSSDQTVLLKVLIVVAQLSQINNRQGTKYW